MYGCEIVCPWPIGRGLSSYDSARRASGTNSWRGTLPSAARTRSSLIPRAASCRSTMRLRWAPHEPPCAGPSGEQQQAVRAVAQARESRCRRFCGVWFMAVSSAVIRVVVSPARPAGPGLAAAFAAPHLRSEGGGALIPWAPRPDLFLERRRKKMRTAAMIGLLLIVLGIVALAVPSITFFTRDRVVDTGFFAIDMQRPHTIVLNPMVGIVSLIAGAALLIA